MLAKQLGDLRPVRPLRVYVLGTDIWRVNYL